MFKQQRKCSSSNGNVQAATEMFKQICNLLAFATFQYYPIVI